MGWGSEPRPTEHSFVVRRVVGQEGWPKVSYPLLTGQGYWFRVTVMVTLIPSAWNGLPTKGSNMNFRTCF